MDTVTNMTITNPLAMACLAFICGAVGMLLTGLASKGRGRSMSVALLALPPLVCAALIAVNGSLGTSVAVLGVFSLVRFRSNPGTAKDIVDVFYAMVIGLLAATGLVLVTLALTVLIGAMISASSMAIKDKDDAHVLKILFPEDGDIEVFDRLLGERFESHELEKLKTASMGSLFEATYKVRGHKGATLKETFDEIRTHNSNLTVAYYKETAKEEM